MNDRTSKYLLGIACIFAGAFMPLILGTLSLLPPRFDPLDASKFIHFTNLMLLTVIAITVMVNILELVEARGRGKDQPGANAPERRHPADRRCGNAAPLHLPVRDDQLLQPDSPPPLRSTSTPCPAPSC